jgi:hypothetical protein
MKWLSVAFLAALAAPVAFGQFSLYQVDGNVEHPVAAVLQLGEVGPEETATAQFRIRNTSSAPAALSLLAVRGTGFALAGAPATPVGLTSQQAIDFSVVFRANAVGTYSAALDSEGIAVILTATVIPSLTFQVDGATLSSAGLNFGTVEVDTPVSRRVTVRNLTSLPFIVPPISTQGAGFTLGPASPSGALFQPLDTASFDIIFQAAGAGTWTGALTIGGRVYPLSVAVVGAPLPRPILSVELAEPRSSRQGSVAVNLDAPARTAGAGTLTLGFEPLVKAAADAAIQLGVVGRSLPFTIAAGDTQVRFGDLAAVTLQTGTTAGTISVSVELGGVTDRKTIAIAPEPVSIVSAQGIRSAASIEVRVNGFDNTRTAGAVVYTFYDASGVPLPSIAVDNAADFASYFAGSDAGGAFALRAVFPVTGDASKIAEFQVEMKNSAGTASTGRVRL